MSVIVLDDGTTIVPYNSSRTGPQMDAAMDKGDSVGVINNLTTTEKSSVVGAINEVNGKITNINEDLSNVLFSNTLKDVTTLNGYNVYHIGISSSGVITTQNNRLLIRSFLPISVYMNNSDYDYAIFNFKSNNGSTSIMDATYIGYSGFKNDGEIVTSDTDAADLYYIQFRYHADTSREITDEMVGDIISALKIIIINNDFANLIDSVNRIKSNEIIYNSINATNYSDYGFENVKDFPLNSVNYIASNITSDMIEGLPEYGKAIVVSVTRVSTNSKLIEAIVIISPELTYSAVLKHYTKYISATGAEYGWSKTFTPNGIYVSNPDESFSIKTLEANTSTFFNQSITSDSVQDLPVYGYNTNIVKISSNDSYTNYSTYIATSRLSNELRVFIGSETTTVVLWSEITGGAGDSGKIGEPNSTSIFTISVNQDFDNYENTGYEVVDSETLGNVHCILHLPSNYTRNGNPVPLIMCAHGTSGHVNSEGSLGTELKGWGISLANGYALFDVNGGMPYNSALATGQHMGGDRALNAYHKAYEYIVKHYNVEPKLYVSGISMGGLTALNFVNKFPNDVRCVGCFAPITDLKKQAWDTPWNDRCHVNIAREYNFADQTGNTWEEEKTIGYNPQKNRHVTIGDVEYCFMPVPVKIWHGTADTTSLISFSEKLINAIRNANCYGELRKLNGATHTINNTTTQNVFGTEVMLYFNRFRNQNG